MNEIYHFIKGNVAFLAYFVPIGSRNESKQVKGISHFLEHMLFKGTKTKTTKQISYEIERYGAILNAFTDTEVTCYWVQVDKSYLEKVKIVLKDMIFNSTLPIKEIEKEKKVVIQEIKMYNDNPMYYIWEIATQALFIKNSGLHEPITGSISNVEKISREDLLSHYAKYKNKVTQLNVSSIHRNWYYPIHCKQHDFEIIDYDNTDYIVKQKGITQTNMLISGLTHLPTTLDTKFSLRILQALLNDMSGRLFNVIREQNNLVYSVYFHYEIFTGGIVQWNVYAALDVKNMHTAKKLIEQELTRFVRLKEQKYAEQKLIGQTTLALNNPRIVGQRIIYSSLQNLAYSSEITEDIYKSYIKKNTKKINQFLQQIDFKNNRLIAIVPE